MAINAGKLVSGGLDAIPGIGGTLSGIFDVGNSLLGGVFGGGGDPGAANRDALRKKLQSLGFPWRNRHGEDPNGIDSFDDLALQNLGQLYTQYGRPIITAYKNKAFTKQNLHNISRWQQQFAQQSQQSNNSGLVSGSGSSSTLFLVIAGFLAYKFLL